MTDETFEVIVRDAARSMVEDRLAALSAGKLKPIHHRRALRLTTDVEVHPLWWALPNQPNPDLRLVREAA